MKGDTATIDRSQIEEEVDRILESVDFDKNGFIECSGIVYLIDLLDVQLANSLSHFYILVPILSLPVFARICDSRDGQKNSLVQRQTQTSI